MTANQTAIFVGLWGRDRGLGKRGSWRGGGTLLSLCFSLFVFLLFFFLSFFFFFPLRTFGKKDFGFSECRFPHSSPPLGTSFELSVPRETQHLCIDKVPWREPFVIAGFKSVIKSLSLPSPKNFGSVFVFS